MERFKIGSRYEYCPNGSYWQEITNVFDRSIYLFCDCKKCKGSVYILKPINITKKISKDIIERSRKFNKLYDLRSKIDFTNMDKVKKLLDKEN